MTGDRPFWLLLAPAVFLLLWSGGFAFAKLGVAHAEPMTFLALRYGCAVLLLAPLALVLRPRFPQSAAGWGHLALVGFLIQALYFGLCYVAFGAGVSAGAVALIVSLQPILVGLLAPGAVGERVGLRRWAGLVLGLAGAAIVIVSRSAVEVTSAAGLLAAGGALLAMTVATLWEKRFGRTYHPVSANLVQYAVGLACVGPVAWATETMVVEWVPEFVVSLAYLVIGNSLVAITLLLAMIRAGEASRVSALLFLVPPMAALIAWLVIGEGMPPGAWAGMALAAVGVWLATRPAA